MIDWDLEAPGVEYFFRDYVGVDEYRALRDRNGIVDILGKFANEIVTIEIEPSSIDVAPLWRNCVSEINIEGIDTPISFISAGKRAGNRNEYLQRVRQLDVGDLYEQKHGGIFIEALRNEWKSNYDFVLIDSRTGVTDFGGICTIQLPDKLVLLFVANEQNLKGILDVNRRVKEARYLLPFDRQSLISIPIPTRVEISEYKLSQSWMDRVSNAMKEIFAYWLPEKVNARQLLDLTKIPYIPYFSYGEKLPILEQGTSDPSGLGFAYENLAALLGNNLENVSDFLRKRDTYLENATKKSKSIFISYSKKDTEIAVRLFEDLEKEGHDVWIDRSLSGGEKWRETIENALREANQMIVLVSQNALESEWLRHELSLAYGWEKRIIPVMIGELGGSNIPITLERLQFVDFVDQSYSDALRDLSFAVSYDVAE
jgi:hypothetical protein